MNDRKLKEELQRFQAALEYIRDHEHDSLHEQCPQRIAQIVLSGAAELRDGRWVRRQGDN
jgi:hypothetical protein